MNNLILTYHRSNERLSAETALMNMLQDPFCGIHGGQNGSLGRTIGRSHQSHGEEGNDDELCSIIRALVSMGYISGVSGTTIAAGADIRLNDFVIGAHQPVYVTLDGDSVSWETLDIMTSRDHGNCYFLLRLYVITTQGTSRDGTLGGYQPTWHRIWAGVWRTILPEFGAGWLISLGVEGAQALFIRHENLERALFVRAEQRKLEIPLTSSWGQRRTRVTLFDPSAIPDPIRMLTPSWSTCIPEDIIPRNIVVVPRIQLLPWREYAGDGPTPNELPYPVIPHRGSEFDKLHAHQLIKTTRDMHDVIADINYLYPYEVPRLPRITPSDDSNSESNDSDTLIKKPAAKDKTEPEGMRQVSSHASSYPKETGDTTCSIPKSRLDPMDVLSVRDRKRSHDAAAYSPSAPQQEGDAPPLLASLPASEAGASPTCEERRTRPNIAIRLAFIGNRNDARMHGSSAAPLVLQVNKYVDTIQTIVTRYFQEIGAVHIVELLEDIVVTECDGEKIDIHKTPYQLKLAAGELIELDLS